MAIETRMLNSKKKISVYIGEANAVTPYGIGLNNASNVMLEGKSAIRRYTDLSIDDASFYASIIDKKSAGALFEELNLNQENTYLEQLMLLAAQSIKAKYRSNFDESWGLIVSTTKGNIDALSTAEIQPYYPAHLAQTIANAIGIPTQPIVVSNACVSGILAVSVAKRLIQSGAFKHCIVLSGDLFSSFVFKGFQAFHAVSSLPCKPYDQSRDGITLGEATAACVVSSDKSIFDSAIFQILGDSSINDANHISGPSRTGEGLYRSIANAMDADEVSPSEIDCISAHGTATLYNDEMEGKAFTRAGLASTPVFSCKGFLGHTLGSAGLIETLLTMNLASQNVVPPSLGYEKHGLSMPLNITTKTQQKEIRIFLKTASGFGGSNTAVLFHKV